PAKSGVSGGIIMVIPQKLGLAVYAPPLNAQAHSVRGLCVCEAFSQEWQLHLFDMLMGKVKVSP
ncbi:MAG: glutaminase, partial [Myxococcota bacterium]